MVSYQVIDNLKEINYCSISITGKILNLYVSNKKEINMIINNSRFTLLPGKI